MIDSEFRTIVAFTLTYWCDTLTALDEREMRVFDAEYESIKKSVRYALHLQERQVEVAALLDAAFRFIQSRGFWREWMHLFATAAALPDISASTRSRLHNLAGRLCALSAEYDTAQKHHEQALSIADAYDLTTRQIQGHTQWGNTLYLQHRHAEAREHGIDSLRLAMICTSLSPSDRLDIHILLGLTATALGQTHDAIVEFGQAVELADQAGQLSRKAMALNNLGIANQRAGMIAQALVHYDHALAIHERTHNELECVRVLLNKSKLFGQLGVWDKAEQCLRQANTPYLLHSADYRHQAMIANNLGYVLIGQNRASEAIFRLERAIYLWQLLDDQLNLGNTVGELGRAYAQTGAYEQAIGHLEQSIALLHQFPDDEWAVQLLADTHEALNELNERKGSG